MKHLFFMLELKLYRFAWRVYAQVKWTEIGGREELKRSLLQAIEDPITHTAQYSRFNMDRVKGILLYGPPGCSKTMIAKAIATQCGFNFFAIQV